MKKRILKKHLQSVPKEPADMIEARRNLFLQERIKNFTAALQAEMTQFGIKEKDLKVVVHLEIKGKGKKK